MVGGFEQQKWMWRGGNNLLIGSDLDDDFTHRLITFEIFMGFSNVFPVKDLINNDL